MEILKIFGYILATATSVLFYGIPAIVFGVIEWNKDYYSKAFCVALIIFGLMMTIIFPCIMWLWLW